MFMFVVLGAVMSTEKAVNLVFVEQLGQTTSRQMQLSTRYPSTSFHLKAAQL